MPATLDFRPERLMDPLSRLIRLSGLQAALDLRCLLAGAYRLDQGALPRGELPFHVVLAGGCRLEVAGIAPIDMQAGDFVLLPYGTPHTIGTIGGVSDSDLTASLSLEVEGAIAVRRNTSADPELDLLCGRFLQASGSRVAVLASLPAALHVSLRAETEPEQLRQVVELIRREVARDEPGAVAVVSALSVALLALALRSAGRADSAMPGLVRLAADPRLAPAVRAVVRDPGRDWSLPELARSVAMSRATFARRFAQVAGLAPGDFVQHVRLASAVELLLESGRTIADIAEQVGYRSDVAFAKAFRRAMGTTPAAYRRGGRGRGGTI